MSTEIQKAGEHVEFSDIMDGYITKPSDCFFNVRKSNNDYYPHLEDYGLLTVVEMSFHDSSGLDDYFVLPEGTEIKELDEWVEGVFVWQGPEDVETVKSILEGHGFVYCPDVGT